MVLGWNNAPEKWISFENTSHFPGQYKSQTEWVLSMWAQHLLMYFILSEMHFAHIKTLFLWEFLFVVIKCNKRCRETLHGHMSSYFSYMFDTVILLTKSGKMTEKRNLCITSKYWRCYLEWHDLDSSQTQIIKSLMTWLDKKKRLATQHFQHISRVFIQTFFWGMTWYK